MLILFLLLFAHPQMTPIHGHPLPHHPALPVGPEPVRHWQR